MKRKTGQGAKKRHPTVYLIAGPNGAGKTTFASEFLPEFVKCREFLNADLIAAGLSPFAPESQNVRAGRLLLQRIDELAADHETFGFETTFSGRTYVKLLGDMKSSGYHIALFFLWLPNADMAVQRVENRVQQGGHAVPPDDIRRRYWLGAKNLFELYLPIADVWWLYDASRLPPKLIASKRAARTIIENRHLFKRIAATSRGPR
jgi:predicted ABC-type ATPase